MFKKAILDYLDDTIVAISFASDAPVVVTEITHQDGLERIWWVFVAVLTLIVGIFLFSRLWRRASIVTDAAFYERRYEGRLSRAVPSDPLSLRSFLSGIFASGGAMSRSILPAPHPGRMFHRDVRGASPRPFSTSGFIGAIRAGD